VNRGRILGAPDALVVEQLIGRSIIEVKEPKEADFVDQLLRISNLHTAEAQVLALTRELDGIAIVDEGVARQVARIFGIQAHGTIYLLLRLVYRGKLSKKRVRRAVEEMISFGWRLTAEEYAKLIEELEV